MTADEERIIIARGLKTLFIEITDRIKKDHTSSVLDQEIIYSMFRDRQAVADVGKKYGVNLND